MPEKLRILQVVGDPVGGIRKHVHDILSGLSDEFDFFYISSRKGDSIYQAEIEELIHKIVDHRTMDIVKRPAISDILNIFRIFQFIKHHHIDLVPGHGAKGGLYARVAGKLAGCKVVYTPHGGVVHNMFKPVEARIYIVIEKILCHFTDLMIFESHYTAEAFTRKFICAGVDKAVNYNGVKLPGVSKAELQVGKNYPKKIGVFSMLREEKGIRLAFHAAKELLSEGELLEFHFFGEGGLRETLEQEARVSNMAGQIVFHGEVNQVYQHMVDMDFVMIPSLFESFGYVAVESMMAGVPVISSNAGGLKEVVSEKQSFVFESGSCEGMKNAILKATSVSVETLQEMTDQAKQRAITLFSLERMCHQLRSLYKQVCFHEQIK